MPKSLADQLEANKGPNYQREFFTTQSGKSSGKGTRIFQQQGPSNCRNLVPKGSRSGFGPKGALSQGSQKEIVIAGPRAFKLTKFASKRLPARIWLKRAVSQGSQKRILTAGPRSLKLPKLASKRLPGQDLAQNDRFPRSQKKNLIAGPRALKLSKSLVHPYAFSRVTWAMAPSRGIPGERAPRSPRRGPAADAGGPSAMLVDGDGAASSSRAALRVFCPVTGCPASDPTKANGWANQTTMRAHIDTHLSGSLAGEIPSIWLQQYGRTR